MNIEKIDKWLNEEYGISYTELCDTHNYLYEKSKKLEQENKELNNSAIWWTNRFNAVERDNREYKARIDKAIEHLKEVMKDEEEYEEDYIYNKYLLDILQGSDKE